MLLFTKKLNYPLALYPPEIEYFSGLTPNTYPVPQLKNEPLLPVEEANINYIIFSVLCLISGIGNCNMSKKQNNFIGFAFIVSAVILYFIYREAVSSYNFKKKIYNDTRNKNQKIKEAYIKDVEFYNKYAAPYLNLDDKKTLSKFRRDLFIEYFKKTGFAKKTVNSRKGVSEKKFHEFLNIYFGDGIKTNIGIGVIDDNDDKRIYAPDFVFIDSNSGLHIDIEIDEPYTIHEDGDKIPIHVLNSKGEQNRDSYFLSNNWIVLRFAEEQIVRFPEYCAFALAYIILEVLGDVTYVQRISKDFTTNNEDVKKFTNFKRWTYEEAEKMALENYRKKYINIK